VRPSITHGNEPAAGPPPAAAYNPDSTPHLTAALQGDAEEFNQLTEPYRRELRVHCYRILGSLVEAEDMVQETLLNAWKRLRTYQGRSTFRAWLYKIATNACLDALAKRRSRRLLPANIAPAADPHGPIAPPATEITWLEPFPDECLMDPAAVDPEARYSIRESVSLAFLAALQTLPPRQRAVLILSDVLDWSAQEMGELLGASLAAVASALRRARVTMAATYQGVAPEARRGLPTDPREQQLLERYVQAWQSADVEGLVGLLKEEAVFSMPPSPAWYRGREAIGRFVAGTLFADGGMFTGKAAGRWKLEATHANGEPAFVVHERSEGGEYRPSAIYVLEVDEGRLAQMTCFLDPRVVERFMAT
jgi:RNA polymerase sigma-70 factor (ECF subfamily)